MSESIKALVALVLVICLVCGFIVWLPGGDMPASIIFYLRYGCPALAAGCLAFLVWAQTRKDKAPDLLARISARYFERDGFCFSIVPHISNRQCSMQVFFQNRFSNRCEAQILIRPTSSFFSATVNLPDIALGISCGPGEFGCSTIPWAIPEKLQGKQISLSLYAGVKYPNGRGGLLRYRDGMRVGSVSTDVWREGLQIAGAVVGALVISRPARINIILPKDVISEMQDSIIAETKVIWKLGDPLV